MAGSNMNFVVRPQIQHKILKLLGFKPSGGLISSSTKLCTKAGVPASNTEADAPEEKGDFCLDTTNDDVYICSAYTSSTNFTWTKVT